MTRDNKHHINKLRKGSKGKDNIVPQLLALQDHEIACRDNQYCKNEHSIEKMEEEKKREYH